MATQNDYIKKIEFFTIYPNKEGTNTLLMTVITTDGFRGLLYAPYVEEFDATVEQDEECWYDEKQLFHTPIHALWKERKLIFNGNVLMARDKHNNNEWFIKFIYLDGPQSKPTVNKKDIEKLFGCEVNG